MRQYQKRVARLYKDKGYTNKLEVLVLGLCEEAGEICAAVLDMSADFKAEPDRIKSDLAHELKDCLVYLCAIANAAGIDLGI